MGKLVMDGCAKSHFFNVCASSPVESERTPLLKHFHHFYSYLFVEFDKFWLSEKPRDVMEFNRIRDLFENQMRTLLEDQCSFKDKHYCGQCVKLSKNTVHPCHLLPSYSTQRN